MRDAEEIKEHEFFKDIDWNLLAKKKMEPPFIPKLDGPTDLRFFDNVCLFFVIISLFVFVKMFTEEVLKDSPIPSKILSDDYQDFTYEKM